MQSKFAEELHSRHSFAFSRIYDLPALFETSHFAVQVVYDPKSECDVYGVVNTETGVIEHFTNALSRAKYIATEATKEAVEGPMSMEAMLARALSNAGLASPVEEDDEFPGRRN